ncbi:MAG: hypothetical protein ACOYO0_04125 [Sandarakinorhabdus sp.]
MTTNDKPEPTITPDGAVEIDEAQLDQAAGGASDYLLKLDGIKGESQIRKVPGLTTRP